VERALRVHVETTGSTLPGGDKKETQQPTAFMMMTTFAAVLVLKVGPNRQLARPFSAIQQSSLRALGVSTTAFTVLPHGEGHQEGKGQRTTPRDGYRRGQALGVMDRCAVGTLLPAASTRRLRPGWPRCTQV
jgi:hypothetical protein